MRVTTLYLDDGPAVSTLSAPALEPMPAALAAGPDLAAWEAFEAATFPDLRQEPTP